jgi:hypothetical protein
MIVAEVLTDSKLLEFQNVQSASSVLSVRRGYPRDVHTARRSIDETKALCCRQARLCPLLSHNCAHAVVMS